MLINNPEALKSWLVIVLEPLCDADSSALARYVLALLKKDKPEKELKRVMIEQLDVFLGEETKPFVERLFTAIGTEEYLSPSALTASSAVGGDPTKLSAVVMALTDGDAAAEDALKIDGGNFESATMSNTELKLLSDAPSSSGADKLQSTSANEPKTKDNQNNSHKFSSDNADQQRSSASTSAPHHNAFRTEANSTAAHATPNSASSSSVATASGNHVRSASPPTGVRSSNTAAAADKENQPRESRRRRASLRSRSRSPRSRSRSNERLSRRSRSRDRRANEREKNQRQFRNKSPPLFLDSGAARHERRRGGGGGLDRRRIGGGGGMNLGPADERSPRFGNNDIGARKRTHRSNSRSRSPSLERGSGRTERNKVSPRRVGGGGGVSPADRHTLPQHDVEKRQRCRDFDEKGYCVRGETCPWDHGINPVVFDNNTALISMSLREYNPDAPDLWARGAAAGAPQTLGGAGGGGAGVGGGINPFTGAARPGGMVGGVGGGNSLNFALEKGGNGAAADYSRAAGAGNFRGAAPLMPFPFNPAAVATPLQRELIPIPVVDASGHHNAGAASGLIVGGDIGASALLQHGKRRYELEDAVAIADGPPVGPLPPQQQHQHQHLQQQHQQHHQQQLPKRKMPLNSRLGPPRMQSLQLQQQSNCSLELRKVPRGLNTIAHLNNHFAKFGKIVNIQISYDGDPEAAIVTFSTHAEANVAYRSTEAVLNNRFIKVFWHAQTVDGSDNGNINNNNNSASSVVTTAGGRKNSQYHLNNVPAAVPTPTADSAKTVNITSAGATTPQTSQTSSSSTSSTTKNTIEGTTAATAGDGTAVVASHLSQPSLRLKNNIGSSGVRPAPVSAAAAAASTAIIRKNQQEKAKAVVNLANGLRKRKQELLQTYVKQMKSALEIVERSDATDPQRVNTLATIKILNETIDKLRKEIAAEQAEMQSQIQSQQAAQQLLGPPPAKKTKEQQKRELLDIELELFAQQQEGNDTTAIQRRLEELQRSLGIVPTGGGNVTTLSAGAAGGGLPNAGGKLTHRNVPGAARIVAPSQRPTFPDTGSTRVDRRPKAIVVTGFTSEEADFVLGHFKHFGEITKHDVDKEIPQLILSYATRINAEQAVLRGKLFKDKRLQITWAPVIAQPAPAGTAAALAQSKATTLLTDPVADNSEAATKLAATATGLETMEGGGGVGEQQHRISESEAMTTSDTLPELRLEDEEDDEESEDRSWRR